MKALLIFLALSGAAWSSHAKEFVMKPMNAATVSKAKERARQHCAETEKQAIVAVSEFEIATAQQGVALDCDCMPTQIEATAKTIKGIGFVSADASKLHELAVEVCAAHQYRSLAPSVCEDGVKKDQTIKDARPGVIGGAPNNCGSMTNPPAARRPPTPLRRAALPPPVPAR